MLCPECKESYRYVATGYHKAGVIYRWVPIAELEAAAKEREERVSRTKSDCLSIWREKLSGLSTKKALWDAITRGEGAQHWQSYGTFLKHNKGRALDEIRAESEHLFESISHHSAIYSLCGLPNPFPRAEFLVEHSS